ncbi:hypothetical protein ACVXHB_29890 [Escherichia coli]
MSIKTSNTDFKTRIRQQIEDPIMRKAVANAQQRIGQIGKMVDELGHWEEWRDWAAQIRDHVLSNLDAYLYQLSEKVTQTAVTSILQEPKKTLPATFTGCPTQKCPEGGEI